MRSQSLAQALLAVAASDQHGLVEVRLAAAVVARRALQQGLGQRQAIAVVGDDDQFRLQHVVLVQQFFPVAVLAAGGAACQQRDQAKCNPFRHGGCFLVMDETARGWNPMERRGASKVPSHAV